MKRSTDRILVTHVGSLARPKDLMEMLVARNESKDYDAATLAKRTREAVAEVVQKQIDCGVDIVTRRVRNLAERTAGTGVDRINETARFWIVPFAAVVRAPLIG